MQQDKRALFQVIGCLLQNPSILSEVNKYKLEKNDFPEKFHKIVFAAINNLYCNGAEDIDYIAIDNFLSTQTMYYKIFTDNNGIEWVQEAKENSSLANFEYYYNRVKKFSLLREYEKAGINVYDIYDDREVNPAKQEEMQLKFDSYNLQDIINIIDTKQIPIKERFLMEFGAYGQQAGKNLKALVESFKEAPEMGVPLNGDIFNTIVRGARLKKLFMRSAPTGVGKTRLSVGDACKISIGEIYNVDKHLWERNGIPQPTLFITTELSLDEVQTMILAYVTGIDEDAILDGILNKEQEDRIKYAIRIIENSPLHLEHLPNFDVNDIETTIKKYVLIHQCKYIFFDYVHTSLKLLEELSTQSKGMRLREDNVLLMFVDRLKNICNQLGVFIYTATQVNGEWKNVKDADQNLLRGAKAMADKLDVGLIALEPTNSDLEALKPILQKGFYPEPNLVYHIYKNRRGKLVRVKLWLHVDLGTCRVKELFVTNKDYQVIPVEAVKIIVGEGS